MDCGNLHTAHTLTAMRGLKKKTHGMSEEIDIGGQRDLLGTFTASWRGGLWYLWTRFSRCVTKVIG